MAAKKDHLRECLEQLQEAASDLHNYDSFEKAVSLLIEAYQSKSSSSEFGETVKLSKRLISASWEIIDKNTNTRPERSVSVDSLEKLKGGPLYRSFFGSSFADELTEGPKLEAPAAKKTVESKA